MTSQIVQMGPKGRVVRPARYRHALGLKPGDDLVVTLDGQDARHPWTTAWSTDRPAATTARGRPAARRGHPPPPARGSAPAQPSARLAGLRAPARARRPPAARA